MGYNVRCQVHDYWYTTHTAWVIKPPPPDAIVAGCSNDKHSGVHGVHQRGYKKLANTTLTVQRRHSPAVRRTHSQGRALTHRHTRVTCVPLPAEMFSFFGFFFWFLFLVSFLVSFIGFFSLGSQSHLEPPSCPRASGGREPPPRPPPAAPRAPARAPGCTVSRIYRSTFLSQ